MKKARVLSYPLSASEGSDQTGRISPSIWIVWKPSKVIDDTVAAYMFIKLYIYFLHSMPFLTKFSDFSTMHSRCYSKQQQLVMAPTDVPFEKYN